MSSNKYSYISSHSIKRGNDTLLMKVFMEYLHRTNTTFDEFKNVIEISWQRKLAQFTLLVVVWPFTCLTSLLKLNQSLKDSLPSNCYTSTHEDAAHAQKNASLNYIQLRKLSALTSHRISGYKCVGLVFHGSHLTVIQRHDSFHSTNLDSRIQ